MESHKRSIIKTLTWRILATLTTIVVAYLFTRELILSLEIGGLGLLAKTVLYYFHERIWSRIEWGIKRHPLSNLSINKELKPEDLKKIQKKLRDSEYIE